MGTDSQCIHILHREHERANRVSHLTFRTLGKSSQQNSGYQYRLNETPQLQVGFPLCESFFRHSKPSFDNHAPEPWKVTFESL